jgi:hypothetical protein
MHATMRQGFNRWNIPSSGDRLALELFGRERGVQIQAWLEGEVEMIALARVGDGEPEILYCGPLAAPARQEGAR